VVALLSWVFLRERIGLRGWLSIGFAVAGIALFSLSRSEPSPQTFKRPETHFSFDSVWLGNLLVFGAVVCEASYAVIGKKLTGSLSPRRITALINLWGLALMTPFGLIAAWSFDFGAVHGGTWLLLVFYALAASVWTVWLWMSGLKTGPAARAGVFTVMLPISAALVGVIALGERLSHVQMLAFGLCLMGVVLATLPVHTTSESRTKAR
jgi:drug/metabolite transporter (DMT)-like permease